MTVYSHSMLSQYANCPTKCRAMYIDRTYPKFKADATTQRGRTVHDAMNALVSSGVSLHTDVAKLYGALVQPIWDMRDAGAALFSERELTVDRNWKPCRRWDDNAYLTGKPDVDLHKGNKAFIVDWKTGNVREDPGELELFACLVQAHFPHLTEIHGMYIWLKPMEAGKLYNLSETETKREEIDDLVRSVELDEDFEPKRSPLCFWCEISNCEHWAWGQDWAKRNGRTK